MLLGLMAFAASASALPARFWGVVPQALQTDSHLERLKHGGVASMRVPFDWGGLQPVKNGAINWSQTDPIVQRAANANLELLPFLTGAPKWAVPSVPVPGDAAAKAPAHLPATGAAAGAWSRLLKEAVHRYGPVGTFWTENPTVPKHPIRTWQIWNEENFKYFVTKPNPAEYGKLVKLSYSAIKSVDSGGRIVLGGMFSRPKGANSNVKPKRVYFASDFLEQMYEKTPGIKTKFQGAALHPYTKNYQELTGEIEEFRDVLIANDDAAKGLWITELGWSSQPLAPATNIFAKGEAGQASQLKGAFTLLKAKQAQWKLQRVYWFSVDDQADTCNFCDGSGLFAEGFVPKQAWYSYVNFAGGTP